MKSGVETTHLRLEIERALRRAFDPADVLPRLARLARLASPASDDGIFAHRQLAELLVERHPWRAALYARKALFYRPDDDRAWAVLAFCQTLLGNFRAAVAAYRKAIAAAPSNPWYAHNLGHLLDVALGRPDDALRWLKVAYAAKGDNSEIIASYAHALARAGDTARAREVLVSALAPPAEPSGFDLAGATEGGPSRRTKTDSRELLALLRWLDQGAPSRKVGDKKRRRPAGTRLSRLLEQGLSHLPLDSKQRERALALARDASAPLPQAASGAAIVPVPRPRAEDVADLAAAVAYAIVYVDHLPLSQAEVAAPFRVAVARLRGRFAELRAQLDLIPGDARYATTR